MDPVERPPRIELDGAIERGKGVLETSLHQQSDTEPVMNLGVLRIVREGLAVRLFRFGGPSLPEKHGRHPLVQKHFGGARLLASRRAAGGENGEKRRCDEEEPARAFRQPASTRRSGAGGSAGASSLAIGTSSPLS